VIRKLTSSRLRTPLLLATLSLGLAALFSSSYWAQAPAPFETDQLPTRGIWTRTAEAPISARTGATIAWNGSEIIVVGGSHFICPGMALCRAPTTPPLRDGAAYNPTSDTWRTIADAPHGIGSGSVASIGLDIYILAFTDWETRSIRLLRYRSSFDYWEEINLPGTFDSSYLVAFEDNILLGSYSDERGIVGDWLLDTNTQRWEALPDDPLGLGFSRQFLAHGEDLYLFDHALVPQPNGASGPSYLRAARWRNQQWTVLPTADSIGSAPILVAGQLLIAAEAGCGDGGSSNNFGRCIPFGAVFDTATDTWRHLPSASESRGRYWGFSNGIGDDGLVIRGSAAPFYDTRSNTWFRLPAVGTEMYAERSPQAAGPYGFSFGGIGYNPMGSQLLEEAWIWKP